MLDPRMSFLDRIAECNRHDLAGFCPFIVDGLRVGWVRHALVERLAAFDDIFVARAQSLALRAELRGFDARSSAMDRVVRALEAAGIVRGRRDEFYPVASAIDAPPLFRLERAAIPAFGVSACGVHMTGYVRRPDGLWIWVPRRARDKSTYPGMLDNTVAGGQPIGIGRRENLIKECHEEAGIPASLAARAVDVGSISYCMEAPEGLKPDVQFCFDLELPEGFMPVNTDGETESFELWSTARVMATVRDTRAFKDNCNLVLIDFFIRHGLIDEAHPGYVEMKQGLGRWTSDRPEFLSR